MRRVHVGYRYRAVPTIDYKTAQALEPRIPKCVPVTHTVSQTCTKTEAVPIQYICGDGSAPHGKDCPVLTTSVTEAYCKDGQLDMETGLCAIIDIRSPNTVCSIGQLQPDGTYLSLY